MDNIYEALIELGLGGIVVAMIYFVTTKLNKSHEKERESQEKRHLAERKECRKALEDITKEFNETVSNFSATLTEVRIELARLKNGG